ncbi:alpha-glucosidase [Curtobacterium sp. 9128]|uniref:alpha-glucosidase n=1 Tax=Curtobacterium sp. 9128 TaxID=1793722 RepID=UPI0011A2EF8F|nr:alpha-glucosidase [Curtobacterium sp. 9128]
MSGSDPADRTEPWWTDAVVYQVYPRSFADGNGDGVGDLAGIRQHLDHIADLGVDVIWLSPVYRSPQADNGYDISDYEDIDPLFGTIDEFDALLVEVHRRGMKLVMDLVVNHSSDRHPWFQAAKRSRSCPKHDWYIWRDPVDGHEPNEWRAAFGGPAWSWDPGTGQYYLHMFTPQQPDLNWDDPDMRSAVYAMMNGWLDRGVDGFRMDVINHIAKDPAALSDGSAAYVMQPRIHDHLREMHERVFAGRDALLTVGEMPGVTVEDAARFTDPARHELDMVFQFEHVGLDHGPSTKFDNRPFDLPELKASLARWQDGLAEVGWNSLYLGNHDQPRAASRFGAAAVAAAAGLDADPLAFRYESATLLATVLHLHRGTPYVYQGDEIGMVNAGFRSIDEYRDVESLNWFRGAVGRGMPIAAALEALAVRSRDNARTPIPWDDSEPAGGFSRTTPWIGMGQGWPTVTVAADRAAGDRSVYEHHRRLIDLRHTSRTVRLGAFALLEPDHPSLWAFTRRLADASEPALAVVANLSSSPLELPRSIVTRLGACVLGNLADPETGALRPWEARVHEFA